MLKKLIWNDVRHNKALSAATIFFMGISAMLLALTAMLFFSLLAAIDDLMDTAQVPDFLQMHTGEVDEGEISRFARNCPEISEWQISRFLNLDNSKVMLGGHSLLDSTQDNGLAMQGERFDFLLGMDNQIPEVLPGEVYVPVCYRAQYGLAVGDAMAIDGRELMVAGFIRDAQMNSMMASSKRFLVNPADYESLKTRGREEYLIEFLLQDGVDANGFSAAYTAWQLPANGPAITRPLIRMMNALSEGMMIFVIFLVSITVLWISLLCIQFILSLRIERDRREVGLLKTLGIGKRDILQMYFAKYFLFSVCGALLGLMAAFAVQHPLAKQLRELYGTADWGWKTWAAAFLAVLLAEGTILFFICRSLEKANKLSILEALFPPQNEKSGLGQYLLIGFVTAACTFLMLVPQNLYSTLSSPKFVTYMGIGSGEIRIDVRQGVDLDGVTAQIAAALKQDAEVEKYAVLRTKSFPAVVPGKETANLTVETGDHSIFPVNYSAGSLPSADDEIALSSLSAAELGLSVGDTVQLSTDGGDMGYTVCGIYSDITNGGKTAKISGGEDNVPVIWSVLYVTLKDDEEKGQWMERYRQMGANVTDIADYVRSTYAQTLAQIHLAAGVATAIAIVVVFMVVMLFLRLIVEQDRYMISLHKALGFTGKDMEKRYFFRGFLPAAVGMVTGLLIGNLLGEALCGIVLESFGAERFRFAISWGQVLTGIPVIILGTAVLAIWVGTLEVRQIKAYECCMGKE